MLLYYLIKGFAQCISFMPFRARNLFGRILGRLAWSLVPQRRRKMAIDNVMKSLACEEEEAVRIVRASTVRFGRMITEVFYFPGLTGENIRRWVSFEGKEYLEEALQYGRGVILATAHSGNWELLGAALALYGFPIVGVAQKQTNLAMDRLINEYRTISGMHITYKSGVREMIRLLGEGKIVGLIMDQDSDDDGVFVEFFGRLASTAPGAAALARMKGAPIVPTFITEKPDGRHTVLVHPPVWVEKTEDRQQDILLTTRRLTMMIETHVRQHPEEWFWLHNRWKHQPQEEATVRGRME